MATICQDLYDILQVGRLGLQCTQKRSDLGFAPWNAVWLFDDVDLSVSVGSREVRRVWPGEMPAEQTECSRMSQSTPDLCSFPFLRPFPTATYKINHLLFKVAVQIQLLTGRREALEMSAINSQECESLVWPQEMDIAVFQVAEFYEVSFLLNESKICVLWSRRWVRGIKESVALIAGSNCYLRGQIKLHRTWKLGGRPNEASFWTF